MVCVIEYIVKVSLACCFIDSFFLPLILAVDLIATVKTHRTETSFLLYASPVPAPTETNERTMDAIATQHIPNIITIHTRAHTRTTKCTSMPKSALTTFRKEAEDVNSEEEMELHGFEVAALMNLVATDTAVEEAVALIPSLSRFPESAVDEILDLIRSTMIRIVSYGS